MTDQIIIIGAGEAGGRAAMQLRELQFAGRIILVGDERFTPYERPPLSKDALISAAEPETPRHVFSLEQLAEQRIEFIPNVHAKRIERDKKLVLLNDGSRLTYSKLLIATGAASRKLTLEDASEVHYLRTFADAQKLRERLQPATELVVIGAGFIGLEIASSATARGCNVTILEAAPAILTRGVPSVVSSQIAERHRDAGVKILTGVGVESIARQGARQVVRLTGGRILICDLIVAGIGAVPVTRLAEEAGLAIENGIKVDEFLGTDDPDIWAAGVCCSFPHGLYDGRRVRLEAWRNAQDQAAIVASNMLGGRTAYAAVPWFWSDQYDTTLQVTGLYDAQCLTVERRLEQASIYFHLNPTGRLVAASALGPNAIIGREIRLAEMLIAQRYHADVDQLENPAVKLKGLLQRAA